MRTLCPLGKGDILFSLCPKREEFWKHMLFTFPTTKRQQKTDSPITKAVADNCRTVCAVILLVQPLTPC